MTFLSLTKKSDVENIISRSTFRRVKTFYNAYCKRIALNLILSVMFCNFAMKIQKMALKKNWAFFFFFNQEANFLSYTFMYIRKLRVTTDLNLYWSVRQIYFFSFNQKNEFYCYSHPSKNCRIPKQISNREYYKDNL